jgi:PKD repeat protein
MKNKMLKMSLALLTLAVLVITACKKPSASFTTDKTTALAGEVITFTNTSQNDAQVEFDFGDGTSSPSLQKKQTHVYSKPGKYTVNLMVSNKNGKKPSESEAITITITAATLTADFKISNFNPVAGEVVTFTDTSTYTDASSASAEFAWDFGDGSLTATTPIATHIYNQGGSYNVTLTVKNALHTIVSTTIKTITVTGLNVGMGIQMKIAGKWKYKSKTVSDKRNGVECKLTTSTYPTQSLTTLSKDVMEFNISSNVYKTDSLGNVSRFGYYYVLDSTRINFSETPALAIGQASPAYATYIVTDKLLVITFMSYSVLPSYSNCTTTPCTTIAAGEKQVVTTIYSYEK